MSNVIKLFQYVAIEDSKIVEPPASPVLKQEQPEETEELPLENHQELSDLMQMKDQILKDAESFAEEQVRATMEEAAAIRQQAQVEIEAWWHERRLQDQEAVNEARDRGHAQGYQEGLAQVEMELREQYESTLQEASQILEQAYLLKQQIIQEAEPFLIELSTSIAEKVIGRQLTLEPEWTIDSIRKVLSRRREKGIITLCVSPAQFTYIQDAREELLLAIDSQAELQIIPDGSVLDQGCVVRSSFGSIDARIDTQLKEIKNALQQLAMRNEG
ncbi:MULTISPECIES: FliH/SctL family protein [unclassified Paenibacillus]|uniref:FliH/SctL family protein n=1 Tax=unclassified Paenibacillus TaxID=185978 RepID=UPI001AE4209E|nr:MULTISPECIES: FliH/SctL family protein [unclassified Paenibacillus]MBP1156009.1 flagellar assembly protein FliH [Paenibacillus sp. PvP091]MBP1168605.1 flagellar assembly protein FliH [Paenibacillus sp. PvR098]MBP2439633.1 flagellar assembly protein FliH [Paenibacillus sp. PvP052]